MKEPDHLTSDEADRIERECDVNIDVSDESGTTRVYTYCRAPEADTCLSVEFSHMNPPTARVRLAAAALRALRDQLDGVAPVGDRLFEKYGDLPVDAALDAIEMEGRRIGHSLATKRAEAFVGVSSLRHIAVAHQRRSKSSVTPSYRPWVARAIRTE